MLGGKDSSQICSYEVYSEDNNYSGWMENVIGHEIVDLEILSIPVVNVFPNELPSLPSKREVEFNIEVYQGASPIFIAPYGMAPTEFEELKVQFMKLQHKGFIRLSTSPWGLFYCQKERWLIGIKC